MGPPPSGMWGHSCLIYGLFRWPWLVFHLFMSRGCAGGMTGATVPEDFSSRFALFCGPGRGNVAGCPTTGVCTLSTPSRGLRDGARCVGSSTRMCRRWVLSEARRAWRSLIPVHIWMRAFRHDYMSVLLDLVRPLRLACHQPAVSTAMGGPERTEAKARTPSSMIPVVGRAR